MTTDFPISAVDPIDSSPPHVGRNLAGCYQLSCVPYRTIVNISLAPRLASVSQQGGRGAEKDSSKKKRDSVS